MAKFALAVHEDLIETHGQGYVGSKDYFKSDQQRSAANDSQRIWSDNTPTPNLPW